MKFVGSTMSWIGKLSLAKVMLAVLVTGLAVAQFALGVWSERGFIFDDSFITYRYAANLAEGHGITWNSSESPVEGYSNFLLVVVLAPFIKVGFDPLWVTRLLGIVASAGIGWLLFRLARNRRQDGPGFAIVAAALFFILTPTDLLCMLGLETVVYSFFVLWGFVEANGKSASDTRSWHRFGLISFLAVLLRPEAVLLPVAVFVAMWISNGRTAAKGFVRGVAPTFILPLAIYLMWKQAYFGTIFPTAFFIKMDSVGLVSFRGIRSVARYIYDYRIVLTFALVSFLKSEDRQRAQCSRWTAVLFVALYLLLFARVDTLMDIEGRFLYPTVAFVLFLALPVLETVYDQLFSWKAPPVLKVAVSMILVVLVFTTTPFDRTVANLRDVVAGRDRYSGSNQIMQKEYRVARVLKDYDDIQNVRIVICDAGVIPYFTMAPHLDPVGLNDAYIARERNLDNLVDYLFSTQPTLVFWPAKKNHTWLTYGHGPMGNLTRYNSRPEWDSFAYVGTIKTKVGLYDLHLLVNRTYASFDHLRDFLQNRVVDGVFDPFPLPIGTYEPEVDAPSVWFPTTGR